MKPQLTLGVSLKMYFGYQQTLEWSRQIAEIVGHHPATQQGQVELFVFPSLPAIAPTLEAFRGTVMKVGAQNMFWEDAGAYTGEVSGAMLHEMGCGYVEIGHAERRRYFAETDKQIADKTTAALRNQLIPVICIGEAERCSAAQAIEQAVEQAHQALGPAEKQGLSGDAILAYEPQWAIGAKEPASADFIGEVCQGLAQRLVGGGSGERRVIYGGSAGPGLLSQLGSRTGGLFLGRFSHQPAAYKAILDEALIFLNNQADRS
ncbi:triose-phosphate isomerase [Rouxiella badensis]|uniref:triose-phosphate isomerase family protein n=1 Tax=Rouxiella badensis TaxID=1646377 RepID=UPI00037ADC06|nr:triose-phosphate isomerase family protein [Rouxiella badensis]MCC3719174.1 triose-phosphate isomerase [Rouxiella badensis]MCC3731146.1 triose-phosphate isomerase [Rouxiella badensis]MCC3733808.1 triose-phosphate isomerase [Rouxiella badensis]MCC3740795.1 triose-phosphate isomerase [Rouxiella badensis]MCC3761093.1 triose-phosphate isomerase [Rouxiella badensis]